MRIIVVGAGKVGTALCRSLVEEKHDVILIEEKEEYSQKYYTEIYKYHRYSPHSSCRLSAKQGIYYLCESVVGFCSFSIQI